jgi:hypothetical protein
MFPKPGDHGDLARDARFQPIVPTPSLVSGSPRCASGLADLRWHGRKLGSISAGDCA